MADGRHELTKTRPIEVTLAEFLLPERSEQEAVDFLNELRDVRFYQTFEVIPNVFTPAGAALPALDLVDSESMLNIAGVPQDLSGKTVLDVGAFNGGVGFICERRGAERVLCIDVEPDPRRFGLEQMRNFLGSRVEYMNCNLYDLTLKGIGKFDYVICFGVLYHLRHFLLGIDQLHAVTGEMCFIETVFADAFVPKEASGENLWLYDYPHIVNPADHSNFVLPTLKGYLHTFDSCGFDAEVMSTWPEAQPHRAAFRCTPRPLPMWLQQGSYEGEFPADRFRDVVERYVTD